MRYYKILSNSDREKLSKEVEAHLKVGWQLQGGIAATTDCSMYRFFQAIALSEEKVSK